jgi:hypothetical protein
VYLRPFNGTAPISDTKWQVSTSSTARGLEPRWRADSKELFYLEANPGSRLVRIMSVPIGATPDPVGTPKRLFDVQSLNLVTQLNGFIYSPAPDGQRFLVNVFASNVQASLDVILNWARTATNQHQ